MKFSHRLKKIVTSGIFQVIVLALALLLANWNVLSSSIHALAPSGNDSVGHYDVGLYYAKYIFPHTWGWIPNYVGGMPFPQFYPPLFYFVTALFYKISPLSYLHIFEWFTLLLTLSIPSLTALIARRMIASPIAGWFAGGISVFLMSIYYQPFGNLGITVQSTYGVGLVTQLLGFVCLLLWLLFFINIEHSKRDKYLSMFFLWCLFLSNAHVVPTAFIIFASIALFKRKHIVLYFEVGIIPVLLSLFWYIPMLHLFSFMSGRSLGYNTGFKELFIRGIFLIAFIILGIIIGLKKREYTLLGLSSALLIIFVGVFLKIDILIPELPVHFLRSLGSFYLLAPIVVGYVVGRSVNAIPDKVFTGFTILIFALLTILSLTPYAYFKRVSGSYGPKNYTQEHIGAIEEYMKDKTGMVSVEVVGGGRVLNSFIGNSNNALKLSSNYSVLAESAITSMTMIPLRGQFSPKSEIMPVDSYLPRYYSSSFSHTFPITFDQKLDQAASVGVNYFFARTPEKIEDFKKSSHVILDKDFGTWKLFKSVAPVSRAQILSYEPMLLISDVNFKKRTIGAYDYMAFQEAAFARSFFDVVFVNPTDHNLDTIPDLDRFQTLVVSEYRYKDLDKATARIESYAQNHTVILLADQNPLFKRLESIKNKNIHIFTLARNLTSKDALIAAKDLDTVIQFLNNNKMRIAGSESAYIKSLTFGPDTISLQLSQSLQKEVPILIKSSYFPAWEDTTTHTKPYLATPTFMLVYAKDNVDLKFTTDISVYFGYSISLGALVLYGLYIKTQRKNRKNHS